MRLLGAQVALVTGAARGIGRATALRLAEEGAAVGVANCRPEVETTAAAIARLGRQSAAAVFDVADPAAVAQGVGGIREPRRADHTRHVGGARLCFLSPIETTGYPSNRSKMRR